MFAKFLFMLAAFALWGFTAFGITACDTGSSPAQTTAQAPPPQVMSILLYPDRIQLVGQGLLDIGQIQIEDAIFSILMTPHAEDDGSLSAPVDRSVGLEPGKTYLITLMDGDANTIGTYTVMCSGD